MLGAWDKQNDGQMDGSQHWLTPYRKAGAQRRYFIVGHVAGVPVVVWWINEQRIVKRRHPSAYVAMQ